MPLRFSERMRSAVSASALRATQQKVRAAWHLASNSRGSTLVMRAIRDMVPGKIGHFRGHGEHRIHRDRHRQLASGAIVDDAAFRGNFGGALLLVLRPGFKIAVAENLQVNQAQADRAGPEQQDPRQKVESFVRVVAGCARHRLAP